MIDFDKEGHIVPSPDPERFKRETRDSLIAEGRAAYRAGMTIQSAPLFKDADMRIDWQNGWRWERDGQ